MTPEALIQQAFPDSSCILLTVLGKMGRERNLQTVSPFKELGGRLGRRLPTATVAGPNVLLFQIVLLGFQGSNILKKKT